MIAGTVDKDFLKWEVACLHYWSEYDVWLLESRPSIWRQAAAALSWLACCAIDISLQAIIDLMILRCHWYGRGMHSTDSCNMRTPKAKISNTCGGASSQEENLWRFRRPVPMLRQSRQLEIVRPLGFLMSADHYVIKGGRVKFKRPLVKHQLLDLLGPEQSLLRSLTIESFAVMWPESWLKKDHIWLTSFVVVGSVLSPCIQHTSPSQLTLEVLASSESLHCFKAYA